MAQEYRVYDLTEPFILAYNMSFSLKSCKYYTIDIDKIVSIVL